MRQVELASGKVRRQRDFAHELFGEGSTRLGDQIYMITWRTGRGFKLSLDLQQVCL
jgi:glutamine cyclotransferase